jgi:hypothetical protein
MDYNTPVFVNVVYWYIVAAIPYIELQFTSRILKERPISVPSYYKIKMKNNQGQKSACHLKSNKCYCMLYEGYAVRNIICQCTKPR